MIIIDHHSRLIAESDVKDKATGKWSGDINLYHNNLLRYSLIVSQPIFTSPTDAQAFMQNLIREGNMPLDLLGY